MLKKSNKTTEQKTSESYFLLLFKVIKSVKPKCCLFFNVLMFFSESSLASYILCEFNHHLYVLVII